MSFAAKMSLLSETINEQKLYSLFAAEEATHFYYMQKTLEDVDLTTDDPFIRFLNEVIATGSRRPLIFIIQVILEGWGIDHYQLMERSCLNPELKKHLKLILIDEASHHGSGVSLFNESELTKAEFDYTIEMMSEFLNMINIGPVGLVGAVKKYLPHSQEADLLNDISAVDDTNRKLTYIKNMMVKSQSHKILEKIENSGLFQLRF